MSYDTKTIGQNIRTLRKQHGLSMDELAQRMGITPSDLALIEQGQLIMNAETMIRLSEVFGFNQLWSQ